MDWPSLHVTGPGVLSVAGAGGRGTVLLRHFYCFLDTHLTTLYREATTQQHTTAASYHAVIT